jgi:outer membrane protein insertion porin family
VSLGYSAFYRKTDYDDLDVDVASYSVDSLGAGINMGYPISETSRLNFGLSVQKDELSTGKYTVDEIFDFIEKEGDSFTNFKASVGWSESTLNKGTLPTRGSSQSLTLETTIPGSDLSFYKLDYRGQLFHPITSNYTLRLHSELGYGDGYGSTSGLPFYENYYAGGFNSVRGFKDSTLGPRSTPSQANDKKGTLADPDQDPLPFGGNVLITGGAEILFPLPFIKDQRSLRTSLFWDVGNTFSTNCGSQKTTLDRQKVECNGPDLSGLASSVGVGVTWVTALGPLSFALAMPVKKPDDSTETQVFQFSLGQTF